MWRSRVAALAIGVLVGVVAPSCSAAPTGPDAANMAGVWDGTGRNHLDTSAGSLTTPYSGQDTCEGVLTGTSLEMTRR